MFRGSRKHVLDWTSRPEFPIELLELVAPVECRLSARSRWMPRGYSAPEEARLETFGPAVLPNVETWSALRTWWLAHERGANTPNWDIAAACEINGTPGLILVEAKANVAELSVAGKSLDLAASAASAANHEQIALAINEACSALRQVCGSTAISRDSHYQLSNRVAFAWKLASLGIPTVLVYLGFWGDTGIVDAGHHSRVRLIGRTSSRSTRTQLFRETCSNVRSHVALHRLGYWFVRDQYSKHLLHGCLTARWSRRRRCVRERRGSSRDVSRKIQHVA